jgi:hypothetical protein
MYQNKCSTVREKLLGADEMTNITEDEKVARQAFIFGGSFFSKGIHLRQEVAIPASIAQTRTPPKDAKYRAQYIFQIFIYNYELLIEKYSRGDSINELRVMLPDLLDTWEWARREELKVFNDAEIHRRHGFEVNLDAYNLALWLVSIFICLEADAQLFDRLLTLIGNEGEDQLYERLVATQRPGRKPADKLLHPKPYLPLYRAIDPQPKAERAKFLDKFISAWYAGMKGTYWHDSHKGKDGGGYFGYWCFEAAGVVRAFKLNDTVMRDSVYYPKDLVDYPESKRIEVY